MNATTWGFIGVALVAVLALIGTIYTARSARKGGDRSAAIAERAEFTESYSALAKDLRGDRDDARQEMTAVRREMATVVERVDVVERRYGVAVRYIRQLRAVVVEHLPVERVPAIPSELEHDI